MKRIKLKPFKVVKKPKDTYFEIYVGKMCVGDYSFIEPQYRNRKKDLYCWQCYFPYERMTPSGYCETEAAAVEAILKSVRNYIKTNMELINKIVE